MSATLLRSTVAAIGLLAVIAAAFGQERTQYAPVTPTLTERLGQMRDNLFGAGEPGGGDPRTQHGVQVRGSRAGAPNPDQTTSTLRPAQATSPAARRAISGRSYSGTAAMSGRPQTARDPNEIHNSSPNQTQRESVPSLARRPAFGPAGNANSGSAPYAAQSTLSSRRSLQERLAASRQANSGAPSNASVLPEELADEAGSQGHSRRSSVFHAGPELDNVQTIINPTIAGARNADAHATSPSQSSRPAVAGPVAPTAAPARDQNASDQKLSDSKLSDQNLTSSRRGFAAAAPSERLASAMPARDKLPAAAEANEANPDLLFARQSPLIGIETAGPRTIVIGKEATYTVNVQNAGDVAAQDVVVTIRVPEWAEVVASKESSGVAHTPQAAASDAAATGGAAPAAGMQTIEWTLPRLDAKGKERLSLQIVPRQSRPFDLAVQWRFTPITSTAVVQVQEPKLEMTLAGPADVLFGETKIYKMTLANPGTGDAENVVIHLSPLTGQAGTPTRHQIGTIRAGESKVIEVELTARQSGKLVINAAATADGDLRSEVSEEITVRRANLEMKVVGGKVRYAGTVAAYQIEVLNSGNAPAENVQVAAALPSGTKVVSVSNGGQAAADGAKVTWMIPTIRAGGDTILELKCQMNNPGANRLAVQSTAAGELSASAEETTQVEALADLKLDVIEPKGPIAVGADVTYEIRLLNRGTKNATDVKVAGYFSGNIDPVAATGGENRLVPGIVIFKPIASLAAGGEAAFKIIARAKAPGHHMFKAEVVCETAGAKLGSEHTTLFYGDKATGDDEVETQAADVAPRPLAPKAVFEPDDDDAAQAAPALVTPPQAPALRRATPSPLGSVYAPKPFATAPAKPATAAATDSASPALPVNPFALRPAAKK